MFQMLKSRLRYSIQAPSLDNLTTHFHWNQSHTRLIYCTLGVVFFSSHTHTQTLQENKCMRSRQRLFILPFPSKIMCIKTKQKAHTWQQGMKKNPSCITENQALNIAVLLKATWVCHQQTESMHCRCSVDDYNPQWGRIDAGKVLCGFQQKQVKQADFLKTKGKHEANTVQKDLLNLRDPHTIQPFSDYATSQARLV